MLAQTLIVFQALSAALFGLALLLTSVVRRGTRMCAVAGAALLLIGIGKAGLALRDRIADELSIVLAGTLFPLALVLFHFAVSRFVHPGRRALDPVGWVLVVLLGLCSGSSPRCSRIWRCALSACSAAPVCRLRASPG